MSDLVAISRFLSYVLRHAPEQANLSMDHAGWVAVEQLLANAPDNLGLNREALDEAVATNSKKRFALSDDGTLIRANQGHSVTVDLGLEPTTPPNVLYHGTAARFLDSILAEGLIPGERQDVHLGVDHNTAITVGSRHGKPVVLRIDARDLHRNGHQFRRADNGVWLTDIVPATHLSIDEEIDADG